MNWNDILFTIIGITLTAVITWLVVVFSSNTGNTKSYTNVKLEKAN